MSDALEKLGYARPPAEHPLAYIYDEMEARGWDAVEIILRLANGSEIEFQGWLIYLGNAVTLDPGIRLGDDGAADLSRVFGTSAQFWLNLERTWLERMGVDE